MRGVTGAASLIAVGLLLAACGDGGGDGAAQNNGQANNGGPNNGGNNGAGCTPSQAVYNSVASGIIEAHCGKCHGATPEFGAPNTLVGDYDHLIDGAAGARLVDRIVVRASNKTMPPAGNLVPHADLDTLVEWASCGETHPDHSVGLVADRPVWDAPATAPEGMDYFDLLAPEFPVATDTLDLYQCFTFEIPVDGARHIVRMEPVVDESRVLHHIVVLRDTEGTAPDGPHTCYGMPQGSDYIYAWAPGAGPIQFPQGGLGAAPGDRYIVQIHYNNGAGIDGVTDSSGIRFYHAAPDGPTYGMFAPGPLVFDVAAGETKTIEGVCNVGEDFSVLAGMPHMHEVGTAFEQLHMRDGAEVESVISLTGWSFELQYFYEFPLDLKVGDQLVTRCTYDNQTGGRVESGVRTADEMCFNFMYVTPPPTSRYCDSAQAEPFSYTPGECAGDDPVQDAATIEAAIIEADPPELAGGDILFDGQYVLVDYGLYIPGGVPVGEIDEENTFVKSAGQAEVKGDHLSVDFGLKFNVALSAGVSFDDDTTVSVGGTYVLDGANPATLTTDCPGQGGEVGFWWDTDGIQLRVLLEGDRGPVATWSLLTFERL